VSRAACAERVSTTSEMRTLPPPSGSKDMYSAPTRVGTLPEHVLAAMRDRQAPDENIIATRYAAPFMPPPPAAEPVPPPPPPLPAAAWMPLTPPREWEGSAVALVGPRPRSRLPSLMWSVLVVMAFAVLGAGVAVLIIAR